MVVSWRTWSKRGNRHHFTSTGLYPCQRLWPLTQSRYLPFFVCLCYLVSRLCRPRIIQVLNIKDRVSCPIHDLWASRPFDSLPQPAVNVSLLSIENKRKSNAILSPHILWSTMGPITHWKYCGSNSFSSFFLFLYSAVLWPDSVNQFPDPPTYTTVIFSAIIFYHRGPLRLPWMRSWISFTPGETLCDSSHWTVPSVSLSSAAIR